MKYLSVCSGIEAATQAWQPLGWQAVAFSEIEPFPAAVLAHHYPTVPNLGDMTKITYNRETETLSNGTNDIICAGGIELLVGGTPCQSFSVAGKRDGLKGASGLAHHFIRLLREIGPRWFVWENVPGALSSISDGRRDFNFLLRQYAECGYDVEWRVLDGEYVRTPRFPCALPQKRRRLFVVGHLTTKQSSRCEVLFEQDCIGENFKPKRKSCAGQSFNGSTDIKCLTPFVSQCLKAYDIDYSYPCTTSNKAGGMNRQSVLVNVDGQMRLRRLTPIEYERLFGFPDNWTQIPWHNKPAEMCPDHPRYNAIGNSMQINVMEWIGLKIMRHEMRVGL